MAIHLRQICLVAGRLSPVVEDLEAILGTPVCYTDPAVGQFGLENALMAVGSQFLEVVAPTQPGTAAGRYLERRGGDGGYMVITQVPDKREQQAVRANAAAQGVRVAYDADKGDWHIMQLHPGDMRAAFLEVEWDAAADVTGNWHPAGGTIWRERVNTDVVTAITAAELQAEDPAALAAHWSAVCGLPVEPRGGVPHIRLGNADLRFVAATDGRGPGLGGVDLRVADPARLLAAAEARGARISDREVRLCGTRFNLTG
ncbi:VOC family protein [Seohaeicola saemankumensis]|nr:VOC family protein [Seohaeicola saemankumensis]MCA0872397.1 VOC family protein [Seohaeicola saemankumensis]